MTTIDDIRERLIRLAKADGKSFFKISPYKVFGSSSHKYKLNDRLTDKQVADFEAEQSITLPADYRDFLTKIGDGGAGPYYGLLRLRDWDTELHLNQSNFLKTPFPYVDRWNLDRKFDDDNEDYFETKEFQEWEDEYFDTKHITGSMRICHYGCGIYHILVVTGSDKGFIWVDDRVNQEGLFPLINWRTNSKMTFKEWYEQWLTDNLKE
jgi:hypothetical protein